MTSKDSVDELYVWVWLPDATEPVVAGRLYRDSNNPGVYNFNYGGT
ncbi:hypothetical protein [Marinobacter sp. LV10R510-11A]|nr:hypothetical protein [Marinobacter sp. LV10R510-11A]